MSDQIRFRGKIQGVFQLSSKNLVVLMLNEIEDMPKVGYVVEIAGQHYEIKELGNNRTDGQPLSSRDCLTGQPTSPHGAIAFNWEGEGNPRNFFNVGDWVEQVLPEKSAP